MCLIECELERIEKQILQHIFFILFSGVLEKKIHRFEFCGWDHYFDLFNRFKSFRFLVKKFHLSKLYALEVEVLAESEK